MRNSYGFLSIDFERLMGVAVILLPIILLGLPPVTLVGEDDVEIPPAKQIGTLKFKGLLEEDKENENLSAVGRFGRFLIVCPDEGGTIQMLLRSEDEDEEVFKVDAARNIDLNKEEELDAEAIAISKSHVWVMGSHSLKRKRVKFLLKIDGDKVKDANANRERLEEVEFESPREQLFRFSLGQDGTLNLGSMESLTLRDWIQNDPILERFRRIPSKENGIDIEGMAVSEDGEELFVGFRGPILRENYVPVARVKFENDGFKVDKFKLLFVRLDGNGIRAMERVGYGYLILGGPTTDRPGTFSLYHWNGEDCVPGTDRLDAHDNTTLLCRIPTPKTAPGANAEGLCLLEETDEEYRFVVVYDGPENGEPTVFSCPKNPSD